MDTTSVIQLIVLLILLFLSAYFSSAETALSSISKVKARTLEEEGRKHAKKLSAILDRYNRLISTILIGNNIVNLSASALATTFTLRVFGNYAVSIATGVLTLLVLIFGEIVPKTSARLNPEKTAIKYTPSIGFLMTVLFPLVFLVDKIAGFVLLIMGKNQNAEDKISETELRTFVDVGHEDGAIEKDEHAMISNVFDFSDSVAKDIMIPRIDMVSIDVNASFEDVKNLFTESMYTRIPVYEDEKDNVIGFINIKDIIRLNDVTGFSVKDILREGYYTYEFKKTNDLMIEMRKKSMNLAFVISEYGSTVGMITLEDLLEEIVGEIRDEYDQDEDDFITETPNGFLIQAGMKLEDVNDALETDFSSQDYDSIGGLILDTLARLPEDGEVVTLEDRTTLKVCGLKQNRILKVLVTLPKKEEGDSSDKLEKEE